MWLHTHSQAALEAKVRRRRHGVGHGRAGEARVVLVGGQNAAGGRGRFETLCLRGLLLRKTESGQRVLQGDQRMVAWQWLCCGACSE